MAVTLEDLRNDEMLAIYIKQAHEYLGTMGAIEHSFRHILLVAEQSKKIMEKLGYPPRQTELAAMAGYLHDLGNVVNRYEHGRAGALLVTERLKALGMSLDEITTIIGAIGNHEERTGYAVSPVAAAVIIADKSDVHRARVRKQDTAAFTLRDRVNYAAEKSSLKIDGQNRLIEMRLEINQNICSVMEYFEIFLTKMLMCRRAASALDCRFSLAINEVKLL